MAQISVIVPVYKVEAYLDRCVRSVLNQSYSDFQLVLVDDGSPDGCPQICDRYAEADKRVHVIHQQNGGLSAARNTGIDWVMENTDSPWITFLDSDDWFHRDFLLRMKMAAEVTGVSLVVCDYVDRAADQEDLPLGEIEPKVMDPESLYVDHYYSCSMSWMKLFRRELIGDIRYPVGKIYEDCFTTHYFFFAAPKVAYLNDKMGYYFYHQDSISHRPWSPKRMELLDAHIGRIHYFYERNMQRAFRKDLQLLQEKTYYQAEDLALSESHEYDAYYRQLRRRLRKMLWKTVRYHAYDLKEQQLWPWLLAWFGKGLWLNTQKAAAVLSDRIHGAG